MIHHSRGFIQEREAARLAAGARHRASADARAMRRVVSAAAAGDGSAVASLVDRFSDRIRTVARLHRLKPHDVEDVVQTTWLRLLEHGDSIRDAQAVGAWLETTARRESLRVLRLATRERLPEQLPCEERVAPVDERQLLAAERSAALAQALEQLPAHQRRLVSLLLAEPAPSYAEIARTLDIPIGSIGPTRARTFQRLRACRALADAVEPW
jgi:RNA polymerase sigma factor (sigma-70 family)